MTAPCSLRCESRAGLRRKVATARPGEIVGELGLLTESRRSANARAQGPVRVFAVSRRDFQGLLSYHHKAGAALLHRLALLIAARIHSAVELVHALDSISRALPGQQIVPQPGEFAERCALFEYRRFLSGLPFFEAFEVYDVDALLEHTTPWTLPRGRVLWRARELRQCLLSSCAGRG